MLRRMQSRATHGSAIAAAMCTTPKIGGVRAPVLVVLEVDRSASRRPARRRRTVVRNAAAVPVSGRSVSSAHSAPKRTARTPEHVDRSGVEVARFQERLRGAVNRKPRRVFSRCTAAHEMPAIASAMTATASDGEPDGHRLADQRTAAARRSRGPARLRGGCDRCRHGEAAARSPRREAGGRGDIPDPRGSRGCSSRVTCDAASIPSAMTCTCSASARLTIARVKSSSAPLPRSSTNGLAIFRMSTGRRRR